MSRRVRFACAATLLIAAACAALRTHPAVPALRMMSYNIQSGAGNLDRTADAIRREHPDLVALQEVDVHWAERSGFADARLLEATVDIRGRAVKVFTTHLDYRADPIVRRSQVADMLRYIDYVLVSSHFCVRSASVPATQASDHRPFVVDLLLDPR